MKASKSLSLIIVITLSIKTSLFAWTSSNEGVCYSLDSLALLSDSIYYNDTSKVYVSFCHINILANDTLKINEGEILMFLMDLQPGNYIFYGINIYGTLLAYGTKSNPITIGDPESTLTSGEIWGGIKFFNTSQNGESKLSYCRLLKPKEFQLLIESAIYCYNSSPIIDHCTFSYLSSGEETGGCSAISCTGESYPIISFCEFNNILNGVAIWCNPFGSQDTVNYPSPLLVGCNILNTVSGFNGYGCDYDIVILNGGFLDNCYLGATYYYADTTLGFPIDTIGDGICKTTSTYDGKMRFLKVDGVVNPRGDTLITGINRDEICILPTTTSYLQLKNNYPNPFTNFTLIEFQLLRNTKEVFLSIINSNGQTVNNLFYKDLLDAGKYVIRWEGTDEIGNKLPRGIYYYKLTASKCTLIKKAILIN